MSAAIPANSSILQPYTSDFIARPRSRTSVHRLAPAL